MIGRIAIALLTLIMLKNSTLPAQSVDPYLWLEEVDSDLALDWVRARNSITLERLQNHTGYEEAYRRILAAYDDPAQIAWPSFSGGMIYNFWQDADHVRGIIRRTTIDHYVSGDPRWETVLDIDRLAEEESENWVYKESIVLEPEGRHVMIALSRGGADAVVMREFDRQTGEFVEDGFFVPEAKTSVSWIDRDYLYVGTDFGPGSLTSSGYPRMAKRWRRGTPLSAAVTVFEGKETDVAAGAGAVINPERTYEFAFRQPSFFTAEYYLIEGDSLHPLEIPSDSRFAIFREQLLVSLKSDWELETGPYPQGSLIGIPLSRFMDGGRDFQVIYEPDSLSSLRGWEVTRSHILLEVMENVRPTVRVMTLIDGLWAETSLDLPQEGSLSIRSTDSRSESFFATYADFLTPPTVLYGSADSPTLVEVAREPERFDATGMVYEQYHAISADGTEIPYWIIRPADLEFDGTAPTILNGYGGFRVPLIPRYSAASGIGWLERGGVLVVANIRGGGEFGPRWHRAALKENRQRAYDDFIAVAEDLIARGVTSSEHLGMQGGSNGGLLVGVAFTQRPDLFNAVACVVPLLDMKRFDKLLAGASWQGEYGDPDIPEEWEYISRYSPYHNVRAEVEYPEVLFLTSTRDDRVHPGHARKMAARMIDQGHPVLYFENIEGGHGGAANHAQEARQAALIYSYFAEKLAGQE